MAMSSAAYEYKRPNWRADENGPSQVSQMKLIRDDQVNVPGDAGDVLTDGREALDVHPRRRDQGNAPFRKRRGRPRARRKKRRKSSPCSTMRIFTTWTGPDHVSAIDPGGLYPRCMHDGTWNITDPGGFHQHQQEGF